MSCYKAHGRDPAPTLCRPEGGEEPLPSIMHLVPGPQVLTFQNILPGPHAHPEGDGSLVLRREMTPWPHSPREGVCSGSRVLSLGP